MPLQQGELVGGRATREGNDDPASAGDEEVELLAARVLPHSYYLSAEARARLEIFKRRGQLTRELTTLGLPPVYEPERQTGSQVLVGRQVDTSDPAAQDLQQQQQPAWRRLRQQALNPAHNPIMARNIRAKAQLAMYAARGAAAMAAAKPSRRVMRYNAATEEAERTIAKLHVLTAADERRIGSAPLSKPYHPRRLRVGVPANETEGGDLFPGRLARLIEQQEADEEEQAARALESPPRMSAAEQRRREQIDLLADVIVAAPQLGIHELGVYLPHELPRLRQAAPGQHRRSVPGAHQRRQPVVTAAATTAPWPGEASSNVGTNAGGIPGDGASANGATTAASNDAPATTPELVEALRELEISAAAGRAAVAAAEDESHYGARLALQAGGGEGADGEGEEGSGSGGGGRSPAASSYGSGGHYLYEEGLVEGEEEEEEGRDGGDRESGEMGDEGGDVDDSDGSGEEEWARVGAAKRHVDQVTVQVDPASGLQAVLYPVAPRIRRRRQLDSSYDGGVQAALERLAQVSAARTAALPHEQDAMRRADAHLANEVIAGRARRGQQAEAQPPPPTPSAHPRDADPGVSSSRPAGLDGDFATGDNRLSPGAIMPSGDDHGAPGEEAPDPEQQQQPLPPPPLPPPPPRPPSVPSAAALLRLPNEVQHVGRARKQSQPETAGMDVSGRWTEAAVAAGRPGAGAGRRRGRSSGQSQGQGTLDPAARLKEPAWRRMSHAEQSEALVAAAERAAAAPGNADGTVARPIRIAARLGGPGGARNGPSGRRGAEGAGANAAAGGAAGTAEEGAPDDLSLERFGMLSDDAVSEAEDGEDGDWAADGEEEATGGAGAAEAKGGGNGGTLLGTPRVVRHAVEVQEWVEDVGTSAEAAEVVVEGGQQGGGGGVWAAAAGGYSVAGAERLDSSTDEDDPWGVVGADEMGYPVAFQEAPPRDQPPQVGHRLGATSGAAAAPVSSHQTHRGARGPAGDDDYSRSGSWGITQRATQAQVLAVAGTGTVGAGASREEKARSLQKGDVAGSRGTAVTRTTSASVLQRSQSQGHSQCLSQGSSQVQGPAQGQDLRTFFGLRVSERVVHPRDIPPIHLTPPPDWLVGEGREGAGQGSAAAMGRWGGRAESGDAVTSGGSGAGQPRSPSVHYQEPMGRVQEALARAAARRLAQTVRHDGRTFYFSDHP